MEAGGGRGAVGLSLDWGSNVGKFVSSTQIFFSGIRVVPSTGMLGPLVDSLF